MGMRPGRFDRSQLSSKPSHFVDYESEGKLLGSRPLPRVLADRTSAALVAATGDDAYDTPALRFIGIVVIADAGGITPPVLRGHMRNPNFPNHQFKQFGWLMVTNIDGIVAMQDWLAERRVGPSKNRIHRRGSNGRAVRG